MVALPIMTLTLLQFSNGKAIRFVAGFALLPALFGVIYIINPSGEAKLFLDSVFLDFITPTLLPLGVLILATSALGDEVDDRTLAYLVLKPVSRLRIVVEKYAAVVVAGTLIFWAGLAVTWLVITRSEALAAADVLVAAMIAVLCGVFAYGAIFLAISLVVPRALLVGIVYTLLWESLLSRLIPGARLISIRHYVQSIYDRIVNERAITVEGAMQLWSALAVFVVVVVLAIGLATLRLRTMDLE
jgi:ABC-2 type transport system permease protein